MKVIYYRAENGVTLKPTTRVFDERPAAEEYAKDIRTYVGECRGFDVEGKVVSHAYYVPR